MKTRLTKELIYDTIGKITADFSGFTDCIAGMVIPVVYDCDAENATVDLAYHTDNWMKNTNNVLHGGITATILDISMGLLTMCAYGGTTLTPTINLQISYLAGIPIDTDVIVRSKVSHTGKNVAHLTAEMFNIDDPKTLYATATGIFYILDEARYPI